MTDPEMNVSPKKILARMMAVGLIGVAGLAGLGACAGPFTAETDSLSPVAPRVQQLVDANREYPRWEDFPKAPTDLPQPVQVAARVNTLNESSGGLADEVSRIEWTLGDAAAFESGVASRIDAQQMAPVTAQTGADIEAYAQAQRERAKAPPPIDRRE